MKNLLKITLLNILLCAAPVAAADKEPTVDAVLEKYVQAIGGKEAWKKLNSRVIKADLDAFGSTTEWIMQAKAPNKQVTRLDLAGLGEIEEGFDGSISWNKGQSGVRTKEGEEAGRAKRQAEFGRETRLKEIYPDVAHKGTEKINGEEVQILESKPSSGTKERFTFNSKTGLMVRHQIEFEQDGAPTEFQINLSDYREVDGVKIPYKQEFKVLSSGQNVFEVSLKVKEIKHNEKIEDAKFEKPSA